MIVIRLDGGLGNQLFQYAFGKALACKHNTTLCIDSIAFEKWEPNKFSIKRTFELDGFLVKLINLQQTERNIFFPDNSLRSKVWHKIKRIYGHYTRLYERHSGYDSSIMEKSTSNCYCFGYWQSIQYFEKIAFLLRSELVPNLLVCNRDFKLESEISSYNPVCIHVRRGDYAKNHITNKLHGVISIEYYKQAVRKLESKIGKPLDYLIFSDDLEWCSNAFQWLASYKLVQSPLPNHSVYDLYLMGLCTHFIIANSTYSWWAAWLASNPNKIVVAPQNWTADRSSSALKMHPPEWIVI